jgi:hypothetical protein
MLERALVMSFDDARRKCETCFTSFNEEKPHSAFGNKVRMEFIKQSAAHGLS